MKDLKTSKWFKFDSSADSINEAIAFLLRLPNYQQKDISEEDIKGMLGEFKTANAKLSLEDQKANWEALKNSDNGAVFYFAQDELGEEDDEETVHPFQTQEPYWGTY